MLKNIFISMFCLIAMSILFGCNEQSPVAGGILIDDSTYVTVLSSDSVPFIKQLQDLIQNHQLLI